MMAARTTSAAVANAFLELQEQDKSVFPRIDQMKMQKLLYYAQAWWLAIKGESLFDEEIYAWPWGPVVPYIYGEFKEFGRSPIVGKRATELVKTGEGALNFRIREPAKPDKEVMSFLEAVWDAHKSLTGGQLSNATHADGEPWTIVKSQYGDLDRIKPVIPTALMEEVFKSKMKNAV